MQQGFSLVEMLIVSLFGSLLLLATSQGLINLISYQTDQSELLRLAENASLAEMALKQTIVSSTKALIIGRAISSYPARAPKKTYIQYNELGNSTSFEQFSSSDWLLLLEDEKINNNKVEHGIFHLDKKDFGYGLAYKKLSPDQTNPISNTLVNQVELVRFRYLPNQSTQNYYCLEKQPITLKENKEVEAIVTTEAIVEGADCSTLEANLATGIEFAFILVTSKPLKKPSPSHFYLWGEVLTPPKDGLYRQLVSSVAHFSTKNLPVIPLVDVTRASP
ncbi:MAG: prepilin-type N-terminal cleavage/methylation domain-containing protein [Pseudomonadaceae bacterium]|nr:prepilin-type N-terminal cleavage/methylation domain-containing protein [Pseudomonadaceae bacterium]